jgi:hypothetical protein
MAESEARGIRRQMASKLREYEGHLLKLEGELLILRSKAGRVAGDVQARVAQLLADVEHEAEGLRRAGQTALDGLGRAVQSGQTAADRVRGLLAEAERWLPPAEAAGREILRRAAIEAKAVRHGVRVGLRVARRTSRRVRAGRGEA